MPPVRGSDISIEALDVYARNGLVSEVVQHKADYFIADEHIRRSAELAARSRNLWANASAIRHSAPGDVTTVQTHRARLILGVAKGLRKLEGFRPGPAGLEHGAFRVNQRAPSAA